MPGQVLYTMQPTKTVLPLMLLLLVSIFYSITLVKQTGLSARLLYFPLRRSQRSTPDGNNVNTNSTNKNTVLLTLILLLAGDIHPHPGPRANNANIFPCGLCDRPVTWSQEGVCCDGCDVWHHKSCCELCTHDYELLQRSHVQWMCCRCDSINIDSFTFRSYELQTSNFFHPLSNLDSTMESINSKKAFSPLFTSSPRDSPHNSTGRNSKSLLTSRNRTPTRNNPTQTSHSTSTRRKPTAKTNLRLMTINCRSIKDKKAEFSAVVDYTKPDIILGTESWLKGIQPGKQPTTDCIRSSEIFPEDYRVFRNDRGTLGGGVFVAVHQDLEPTEKTDLVTNCEISWVKIKSEKDVYLASFYMPHRNLSDINNLHNSLKHLQEGKTAKHIILTGDFNCPDIDWDNLTVKTGSDNKEVQQALIDLAIEHQLTQVHDHPTRGNNPLDLVFTTNPTLLKTSDNIPGISDHDIIISDFNIKPFTTPSKPRRCNLYHKADWDNIKDECAQLSTKIEGMHSSGSNTADMWTVFKSTLHEITNRLVPSKLIKGKKSLPWFNRKLRRLVRKKARLYKQAKKTKQWATFRSFQTVCKREFRKAEQDYILGIVQEGLEKNNNKPFWRYVKAKKQDNTGIASLKKQQTLISDSIGKAEILIDQFRSVFTKNTDKPLRPLPTKVEETIPELTITRSGVAKLLSGINPSKAVGPDTIPNKILKECSQELAPGLTLIYQHSVDEGTLPEDWLNANVSPIYKKGNVHQAENYRPVSLTSVSCKLLEHILCKHILNHLDKHNVLTALNHGFRSGYSCETQLQTTLLDFLKAKDKRTQTDIAILDFSKAFDTVPHKKLLQKLNSYGITGPLHAWLQCFLMKRHMRTVVEGEFSRSVPVESGVPQGTVLGPLLFLCHINDLPDNVKSQVRLFADDCLLYRKINTSKDHLMLQEDLHTLERWADSWGMRFNAKKCYILSTGKKSHYYMLDNQILQQVEESPYLGLVISQDLKWASHITKTAKKASSTLGFLRRNLRFFPMECKKTTYISLVRSQLEYGCSVWDPYQAGDIDKLEKIQRHAARFITGDYRSRDSGCVTDMLRKLELQPLQDRRRDIRLVLLYRVVMGLVPALPPDQFLVRQRPRRNIKAKTFKDYTTTNFVDNLVTNNSRCLKVPTATCDQYKHSFFVKTIVEWNRLPEAVACADSVEGFKAALKPCCH